MKNSRSLRRDGASDIADAAWADVEAALRAGAFVALTAEEAPGDCLFLQAIPAAEAYVVEAAFGEDANRPPCGFYRLEQASLAQTEAIFRVYYEGGAPDLTDFADVYDQMPFAWENDPKQIVEFPDRKLLVAINLQLGEAPLRPLSLERLQSLRSLKCCNASRFSEQYQALEGGALDIAPLRKTRQLRTLDLSDNYIRDFSPLSECAELVSLRLERTNLTTLCHLRPLQKLSTLFLRGCTGLGGVDVLCELPALKQLMIDPAVLERFGLAARLPQVKINALATTTKRKKAPKEPKEPKEADALRQRAAAALRDGKTDEAVAIYCQLLRSEPSYQLWQSLSACYRLAGDDRQYEAALEAGFLHAPSLSHLDAIWKAYARTKNEQKREALGFVCKEYHVDEIRGAREWKDAAWHMNRRRSGDPLYPPHRDDADAQSGQFLSFLSAVKGLGRLPVPPPEKIPPAERNRSVWQFVQRTLGALLGKGQSPQEAAAPLLAFLLQFFYDDFTRCWEIQSSMRPQYREALIEILCAAICRRAYRQEEGVNGYNTDFLPDGTVLFRARGRIEVLTAEEFYWLAAGRVAHYCDKYHTSSGERERLDALLESYQKQSGLAPLDGAAPERLVADPWLKAAQERREVRFRLRVQDEWKIAKERDAGAAILIAPMQREYVPPALLLMAATLFRRHALFYAEIDCLRRLPDGERAQPALRRQLAEAWALAGQPRYAIRLCTQGQEDIPADAALHLFLGENHLALEEREEALHHLELAEEMGLDGYAPLYRLGRAYLRAMCYRQAGEALKRALCLCAADDAREKRVWAECAYALLRAGALDEACRAARQALWLQLDDLALCDALRSLFQDADCGDIAEQFRQRGEELRLQDLQ